jgi:hypothetical protein
MRTVISVGTRRGLQGRQAGLIALVVALWSHIEDASQGIGTKGGKPVAALLCRNGRELSGV